MGEMVSFASHGSTGEGYLAVPGAPNGSAVIVIQEWWGLVGHIRDLVDRFAAQGYLALAPDLYHGVKTTEPDEAGKLMMGMAMDEAAKDIAAAAAYLAARPEVTTGRVTEGRVAGGRVAGGRVATIGFCMGGSLALWSATLSEHVGATVGFYPAIPWERMSPRWSHYAGKAAVIHCSQGDGTSSAPGIQQAKAAIEEAGGGCVLYDYPGTEHAFFNDDRPEVYAAQASQLAWQRTLEFLSSRLG